MKAAVLTANDTPLETRDDIEIAPPGPGEARVRIVASGVCHSDLSVLNGTIPLPTPIVLGHEGAGVVEEIGEGVSRIAVGDHVVLSFVPACGECYTCKHDQAYLCEQSAAQAAAGLLDGTTRLTSQGAPLHQMACLGTFGTHAIVPEISMVKIPEDVPLDIASLIGCGVSTGVGAAINTAKASPNADWKIIGRPGTTITTDNKSFSNIRMNGTFSDPNANGYAIVPRAQYDWNGQATISGGSLTMTCDNPGDMVFTGRLRFNGCDKIIMDGPTLRYVTTQPGYDLGDGSGYQNQGPQKVYQISIDSLNQGAGDYIFRNMTMGGYAAGVESCFFPSVLITNGNGAGHCVVEDCLVDGFFIGFDMSRTRRGVRRRNWYRRRIVDLDRIYYTRANVTGSNTTPSYQESTMNTDTDPVGMYPGDGGVYAQGAHADWLQIARQWGTAPAHLFWGRNVTVHDTNGSDRTAEIQSVFTAGNPLGLPNVGSTSFSNWATQPQGLHSGKTGIKVTGEFYENVMVSTALNAFTVAGLETDMTRNMIVEGRNLRPHPPSAKNGLRMYVSIGPQAPVTWADNIFPRIQGAGTNVFNNISMSTSVHLDEKASGAQANSHPANFPGPFTSSVDGHIFQLDTSSPAALRADLAAKFTPKPGSMSAGKGPYG